MMYEEKQHFDVFLENSIAINEHYSLLDTLKAIGSAISLVNLKGNLYPFGSFCNGFHGADSDLDCVFITDS